MRREFTSLRIIAPATLPVANEGLLDDTGLPCAPLVRRLATGRIAMNRTPSKPKAALWMAGWLGLMLLMAIAGPRGHARTQRLSDHGNPGPPRPRDALSPDPFRRRFRGAAHIPAADTYRPQPAPLRRPV